MKTFYISQNLWDIFKIEIKSPPDSLTSAGPDEKKVKEISQRDLKVLYILQQTIADEIF